MDPIPQELNAVRAEIEDMYVIRDSGGLTSEHLGRYHSLLATETQMLAQLRGASTLR